MAAVGRRVVMMELGDFSSMVERIYIDEALLMAGGVHVFGAPRDIAVAVRRRRPDPSHLKGILAAGRESAPG
jgi:hypothetical protein